MASSDLKAPLNPKTGPDVAASDPEAPSNPEAQPEDEDSGLTDLLAAVIKLQLPRMDENYKLIQPDQDAQAAPDAADGATAGDAVASNAGAEKKDIRTPSKELQTKAKPGAEKKDIRTPSKELQAKAPVQLKAGDQIVTAQALFPDCHKKFIGAKTKGVVTHVDSFGTVEVVFDGCYYRYIIKEDRSKLSKVGEEPDVKPDAKDAAKVKAPTGDVETGNTGAKGDDDTAKADDDDLENLKCLTGILEKCLPKEYGEKLKALMAKDDGTDKDKSKTKKPMGAKDHAVKAKAMAANAMADMKDPEKRAAAAKKYQADLITNGIYVLVPMILGWFAAPLTSVMSMLGFIPPEVYHITAGSPLNGTAIALAQVSSNMTNQAAIQYAVASGLKQYWIIFMGALSTIGLMTKNMQTIADHLFEVLDSMQTHVDTAFDACKSGLQDGVRSQVKCPNAASKITGILDNSVNAVQKDFKIQPMMPWLLQRKANLMSVVALPIIIWQLAAALSTSRGVNLLDESVIQSAMIPQGVGVNATNGSIGMIELASATLNLSVNSTPFDIDHAYTEIQSVGIWAWFIANLWMAWEQLKTLVTNTVIGAFASGPSLVTIVNIAIGTVEAVGAVAMVEAVAEAIPKKELLDALDSVKDGTSANIPPADDSKSKSAGANGAGNDDNCTVS